MADTLTEGRACLITEPMRDLQSDCSDVALKDGIHLLQLREDYRMKVILCCQFLQQLAAPLVELVGPEFVASCSQSAS